MPAGREGSRDIGIASARYIIRRDDDHLGEKAEEIDKNAYFCEESITLARQAWLDLISERAELLLYRIATLYCIMVMDQASVEEP